MRYCTILLLVLVVAGVSAADHPMRDRVICDREAGIALRIPYHYLSADPYITAWNDRRKGGGRRVIIDADGLTREQLQTLMRERAAPSAAGAACMLRTLAPDALAEAGGDDDAAVLRSVTGFAYASIDAWDYYAEDPARPHAHPDWAVEGITGSLAVDEERCAVLLRHPRGATVLALRGGPEAGPNPGIIASLEVMRPRDRDDGFLTRAEARTLGERQVFDATGATVSARSKADGVPWAEAWEMETPHYHITCNVSPRRTYHTGLLMEALYAAYAEVFQPERMPPVKLEIYITQDSTDFRRLAAANGIPVPPPSPSSMVGGFFTHRDMATYSFVESPRGFSHEVDSVLAHEATHQFVHLACGGSQHVPTWINEGLAVYFEDGVFRGDRFRWQPPEDRIDQLQRHYRQTGRTLMPLERYLSHQGHIPAASYAEVYAMTHFWVFASKEGKKRFRTYWHALRDGEDGAEAFERVFMRDMIEAAGSRSAALERWQKALLRYVAAGRLERAG